MKFLGIPKLIMYLTQQIFLKKAFHKFVHSLDQNLCFLHIELILYVLQIYNSQMEIFLNIVFFSYFVCYIHTIKVFVVQSVFLPNNNFISLNLQNDSMRSKLQKLWFIKIFYCIKKIWSIIKIRRTYLFSSLVLVSSDSKNVFTKKKLRLKLLWKSNLG